MPAPTNLPTNEASAANVYHTTGTKNRYLVVFSQKRVKKHTTGLFNFLQKTESPAKNHQKFANSVLP